MALARAARPSGGGNINSVETLVTKDGADAQTVSLFPASGLVPNGTRVTITAAGDEVIAADDDRGLVVVQFISGSACAIGVTGVTTALNWITIPAIAYTILKLPMPYAPLQILGAPVGAPAVLNVSYVN